MKKFAICCLFLISGQTAWAQTLTPQCETQLALSALPERLRADATVYIYDTDGYKVALDGSGVFSCIVERNHKLALIPQLSDSLSSNVEKRLPEPGFELMSLRLVRT